MSEFKRMNLMKPNINTPFHLDFEWWKGMDRNWRVDLRGLLCFEHKEAFNSLPEDQMIDWVDPESAEVIPMDGLQYMITNHCALQDEFLNDHTTLVDAVFRTFLSNGNTPMSAEDLGKYLVRPAGLILKTLGGSMVYKGIRPYIHQ